MTLGGFRLALAGLTAIACLSATRSAMAVTTGLTIESMSVLLDVPSPESDDKLTTRHEIELTVSSNRPANPLRLDLYAKNLQAKNAQTGQPLPAVGNVNDWYTTVTVPMGQSTVNLSYSAPLFDNALPRFWWEGTEVDLGWPFSTQTPRIQQRLDVTVLAPSSVSVPKTFRCVREGAKKRCTRSFAPTELTKLKDAPKSALQVASIDTSPTVYALGGAQVVLWALLLIAVAVYRITRGREIPGGRGRMLLRTAFALAAFTVCAPAWAYLVDGEVSTTMPAAMTWGCIAFGVAGLLFSHVRNTKAPARTVLGQIMLLGAFPATVGLLALSKDLQLPLIVSGMLSIGSLGAMFGESQ